MARFFLGFGIPFAIAGASQLLSELCYPKERAVISGLFHESWYAGSVLAAGVTLGTFNMDSDWSWRLPTLFQVVPSILQLSFIWFVHPNNIFHSFRSTGHTDISCRFIPESPRFLIAKDRHEEARAILIKYHAEGDENSPLVLAEYQEICEAIAAEKQASTQPWKELFTARNNVRRVLIAIGVGLFAQWSGNGLVSYYLAKVLETIGITSRLRQNQINLGLMCWNLCTGIAGSFVQHWVKRRTQWLTAFTGMTIVYACWTASSAVYAGDNTNEHASRAVVALIFVYYGMYNLMMPLAYVYITEVFPYLQRSKGMGIMLIFSRFGSAFNAFVNPIGLKAIEWRMYIVYTCWLAIETTYIFFVYPETFGLSLEEASDAVNGSAHRSKKPLDKLDGEDNA